MTSFETSAIAHDPYREERVARARGLAAERRVLELCRSPWRPSWLRAARLASRAEDRAGIDVVLESDVGRLFLQVKSSRRGMQEFLERAEARRRRARIAVVVVRPFDWDAGVMQRVTRAVGDVRAIYLEEAGRRVRGLFSPPHLPSVPPQRLDDLRDDMNHRLDETNRRVAETESRLSTEVAAVAPVVREVRDDTRRNRSVRAQVQNHEERIGALEEERDG